MSDDTMTDTPENLLDRLKRLTEAIGTPGEEGPIRALVRAMIADYVDEITVDTMGNLYATKAGTGDSDLHVMVTAHMDEIGLMVTEVNDGVLSVEAAGGFDQRVLPGKPVWVGKDKLPGVVLAAPIHLSDGLNVPDVNKIKVDVGANGGKVRPGDQITFAMDFALLGPTFRAKAIDNRVGCAVLVELLRGEALPFKLTAAFTVQEEVGLRGANVAAFRARPDVALVLEATAAHDLPMPDAEEENTSFNTRLHAGPAINVADRSTLYNRQLVAHFVTTAEAEGIPYQIRQPGGGGNDAGTIHRTEAGIPTATISLPARYIHSPAAIASVNDLDNMVRLVRAGLRSLSRAAFTYPTHNS